MSFFQALYKLLIGPLELIFEVIFTVVFQVVRNSGVAIIFLSLAMNFLVLPLYKRADAMQAEQRETEKRLKPWVDHIKKTFHGDERFMMLQTYYRQNNYKPAQMLKGSVSLLLEIPFFIAAYNFLSGLERLQGVSFGPIADLGAPDGMLVIAGFAINVLPILMTAINIISGIIYTKGLPARSKIQVFGMALIFLVLLYQSPSGLVFYWTLNNVFSLLKNIFYKLKSPKRALCIVSAASGIVLLLLQLTVFPLGTTGAKITGFVFCFLLEIPIIIYALRGQRKKTSEKKSIRVSKKGMLTFFLSAAFLALLTGVLIPSAVIKDSPQEFISATSQHQPLHYILCSALIAIGIFVIWLGIFYLLASPKGKRWMEISVVALAGVAVVDYMFFGEANVDLSAKLVYNGKVVHSAGTLVLNCAIVIAVAVLLYFIYEKKPQILQVFYSAFIVAALGMSFANVRVIRQVTVDTMAQMQVQNNEDISIPLHKNGKNVVVLMMDRAINGYLPYIFEEDPALREQFQGFTYFPNTLSYGPCTNIAIPALFGGYEYRPLDLNHRDTEKLGDKHDEAVRVMPYIFDNAGYDVTVSDPTYAGYSWYPDLSIFNDHPDIRKFTTNGKFTDTLNLVTAATEKKLERDFFCYGVFKISPLVIQPLLYNEGGYNGAVTYTDQVTEGSTVASGLTESFLNAYSVLVNLPEITEISDSSENTFLMMSNDATHEPTFLQAPDYVPDDVVNNTQYMKDHEDIFTLNGRELHMNTWKQVAHYHVNAASYRQLGNWLDYLRENDVYDNTRIIIVADHGKDLVQLDDMRFGDGRTEDAMNYNPLLLVKDFDSKEFTVDNRFMTNADVPTIATYGLIENPVNPFTGQKIDSRQKHDPLHYVMFSDDWSTQKNNGNTFLPGEWFTVHDDIFNMDNWAHIDEEDLP